MHYFLIQLYFFTIFLCISTYALYPMLIWILGKFFPGINNKSTTTPSISIIISAYNEAKHIEEKIKNTLKLDYPKDKIEVLIGSDGSTDATAAKVSRYTDQGIKFHDFQKNRGKTAVQNDLVRYSSGEILVFTDAASFLPANAVKKMVSHYVDKTIGCVAGKMQFVKTDSNMTTESQGLYWRYEVKIREMESCLGSLIGVDGPLYSVRRDNYVVLGPHIISDLITPLLVREQGKKVIIEPEAIVEEEPTIKAGQEFNTRRRVTLRALTGLANYKSLFNPIKNPWLACQLFFHKLLRWFVGPLVAINVLTCLALSDDFIFRNILIIYCIFFITACLGWIFEKMNVRIRIFTIPYYFCLVNLAATMGIIDYFKKKQAVTWKPVR